MNTLPLLSFTNATVKRGTAILFENISFSLKPGEHWAITGAGGSGKSAFLEIISGNLPVFNTELQHTLEIHVQQRKEKQSFFSWQQLIGHVTAKHSFRNLSNTTTFYYQQRFNASDSDDVETVEEYLHGFKQETASVTWTYARVMEKFNLLALKDKHLIKLSNGETKRLLLAAALMKNPLVLLLDDPFTGLDVQTRKELHQLLAEIAASGISIIMSTSPAEIPDVITHVAVLHKGTITTSVEKKQFKPDVVFLSTLPAFDKTELRSLISQSTQPAYNTIVHMQDVTICYDEKVILDQVNWQIKPGERWALTGPNGAGKSTLLSLINGDNPQAYANTITLFDRKRGSGESVWDIKKETGFVSPELFQYFPTDHLCVDVIESGFYDTMGLFRKSLPANALLALRWMKLLGIETAAQQLFKNTSTSTQRLCLLIRALIKNPALLILDEPCQGLDIQQQEYFKQVINEVCNNSNVSVIYVSHYQEQLPDCMDRVLKLQKGRAVIGEAM